MPNIGNVSYSRDSFSSVRAGLIRRKRNKNVLLKVCFLYIPLFSHRPIRSTIIYERRPIKGDSRAFWVVLVVKNLPTNVGDLRDTGSIPGWGRFPEGGMATHSSILAWKSHGQESCRLQSTGSKRVRHDWSDLAHTRQGMIPSRYVIFSASSFRSTQGDIKNGNYFLTAVYIKLYGSRPVFINLIEIMDPFESHLKHCI